MGAEQERGLETNFARITGRVLAESTVSHKTYGETFYIVVVGIERKSGYEDAIKVMVSERLTWDIDLQPGAMVSVCGQVRTYNEEEEDGRSHLNIVIFAREFGLVPEDAAYENEIYLAGFVCKPPIRRTSPLGREICDIMLAVNRMYNKSDYIPCIAWGRNAAYAGVLEVGTKMIITGRIQSREYRKRDEIGNSIAKMAYEVSVLKIEE